MAIPRFETARDQRQFQPGYDVDPSSNRFSNYYHVLRELVHLHHGWLPRTGPYDAKCLMGVHVYEDAEMVMAIKARLKELRHPSEYPAAPGEPLAHALDELNALDTWQGYVAAVYKVIKPALVKAWRYHIESADPIIDEPSTRLLEHFVRVTEKQIKQGFDLLEDVCGTDTHQAAVVEEAHAMMAATMKPVADVGAVEIRLNEKRKLKIMEPLDRPERDPGMIINGEGDTTLPAAIYVNGPENHVPTEEEELKHYFHALLDAELTAAEIIALNSHEFPDMPFKFHLDMARQTWDEIRHAQIHDRALVDMNAAWGDYPVTFKFFRKVYANGLLERLILFNRQSEGNAMWRHNRRKQVLIEKGEPKLAQVFDYLLADEVAHVANGVNWGTYLLGGDKRKFIDKVKEVTQQHTVAPEADKRGNLKGARGFEKADEESEKIVESALSYLASD